MYLRMLITKLLSLLSENCAKAILLSIFVIKFNSICFHYFCSKSFLLHIFKSLQFVFDLLQADKFFNLDFRISTKHTSNFIYQIIFFWYTILYAAINSVCLNYARLLNDKHTKSINFTICQKRIHLDLVTIYQEYRSIFLTFK